MTDGKLRFYDKGKETFALEDPYLGGCQIPETQLHIKEMTHEEMLEEAAKREAIVAKVSEEDYQKVLDAAKEKKVLEIAKQCIEEHKEAFQHLAEIERKDLIDYALEELNAIVMGGQDTREFYQSVTYIRQVLESLK